MYIEATYINQKYNHMFNLAMPNNQITPFEWIFFNRFLHKIPFWDSSVTPPSGLTAVGAVAVLLVGLGLGAVGATVYVAVGLQTVLGCPHHVRGFHRGSENKPENRVKWVKKPSVGQRR